MNEHTPVDKNERLIIGYFPNKEQAEHAVDALRHWDTSNAAVKLGNIGIMVQEDGKLKTSVPRKAGKGAALGLGIGAIAGILSGGMTIVGGLIVGGVVGGALGAMFKKSLGLSPEDMQKIATHLEGGLAAVVVMCDDYEVDGVVADLKQSGGTVESFDMSSALLPDAEKAVNDAVSVTKSTVEGTAAVAAAAVDSGAEAVKQATDATTGAVKQGADATAGAVKQAADATSDAVKKSADVTGDAVKKTADATADTAKRAASAATGAVQGDEGKSPE